MPNRHQRCLVIWGDENIKALGRSVIIRAIKDYQYAQYKREIMDWVVDMQDFFPFYAESMGLDQYILREMMVDKMIKIDTCGTASLYLHGEVRNRK